MESFRIYPNVKIGENAGIGDFVVIGEPPRGMKDGQLETVIGHNAVIRSHSVIYAGNVIGDNFQTGHSVMIRELNRIGSDVSIGTHSVIEHHVEIEDRVRIHSQAFIPEFCLLEEGCWIGPNVVFTNTYHPLCPKAKECMRGPTVGRNAKIGANSTLLPDITVGENSLVAAGSVVTRDVPPNTVVIGSPARVVKSIEELKCHYRIMEKPYELAAKEEFLLTHQDRRSR